MPPDLEGALARVLGEIAETRTTAIRDAVDIFNVPEDVVRAAVAAAEREHHRPECACYITGALLPGPRVRTHAWVNVACPHHPATGTAVDVSTL